MPRALRVDVGGEIYHCINRSVGKQTIFYESKDYYLFEKVLQEVVDITNTKILAYCIMPNHFHLVLNTKNDGELSDFMKRLTVTHTQRYRAITDTVGEGPIYQGRYKSFIVQDDEYLFTVLRYVERNPFTAGLIKNPLNWKYSSLYRRYRGSIKEKQLLSQWNLDEPDNYLEILTQPLSYKEIEQIELSEQKGAPFGDIKFILKTVEKFGLQATLREKRKT